MSTPSGSRPEFKKRTPSGIKPVQRAPQTVPASGARAVQRDRLSWHQFTAEPDRYEKMRFRRAGNSGLSLPAVSLGAWETFGGYVGPELARGCIFRAFNLGITHFDLANNYGNPPGRAEIMVGRTLREMPRAEIVISTKAGFPMWPGPYGEGTSRKSLLANIDQSLQRLGVDHVDIFYAHRADPNTPIEETLGALEQIVRQGKALYLGVSNYPADLLRETCRRAREMKLPLIVAQMPYNMLRREIEQEVLAVAREYGIGLVGYSALAQGLLTPRYLKDVPEGSRAARTWTPLQREEITPQLRERIWMLEELAKRRGQTLPQMAIAWALRSPEMTSALIGASDIDQIEENVQALEKLAFSEEELRRIETILAG